MSTRENIRLIARALLAKCSIFPSLLKGLNVTIVGSSESYGKLKGPVQKLFSMICFHFHKVVKIGLKQRKEFQAIRRAISLNETIVLFLLK